MTRISSLYSYFEQFSPEQLNRVEAVGMDMWEPFAPRVHDHLENAGDKIVFDRYHVMGYLTKALEPCARPRTCPSAGGDKSLTGTKYLWLHSAENLPERHHERFEVLRGGGLKTGLACIDDRL
jgi:transposase